MTFLGARVPSDAMALEHRLFVLALHLALGACTPSADTKPRPAEKREEASAPPPYDLAADRARIVAAARDDLGDVTVDTAADIYVLIGTSGVDAGALAANWDLAKRAIDAYLNGRFDTKPTRAVGVIVFEDDARYQAYCRAHLHSACESPTGIYHPDVRLIVINTRPRLGTLTHEIVHPLVEADFPRAPLWFNEGIASLFEAPVIPKKGEIHGVKNWRLPRLLSAMRSQKENYFARLDTLFGMTDDAFRDHHLEKLHYATARFVCQWLDSRDWLWPFYHGWRDDFANDATGAKTFERVTGMSPAAANAPWTAWVHTL